MVAPIRFLTGRQQQQKLGVEGSTENQKVLEVIGNVGIGTTVFDPLKELDVRGSVNISNELNVTGPSTFVGVSSFQNDLYVDGNVNVTGILTAQRIFSSIYGEFSGSSVVSGTIVGTALSISGISTLGIVNISNHLNVSGVVTAPSFIGNLTGIAASATQLVTPRTFEITGDVVASPISFDGTGNVSLAATIQPNSVGLGTDTFGDYVKDIYGTSQQIVVTSGTGEGSTPVLSLPTNLVIPEDLTVTRDLQVNRNLNVTGNITIGGTSATIFATELTVSDPDIVLGFRTDAFGNDVSNDNTANHGGIAIASTEGTPLVDLFIAGIETSPATYKKIMWFKEGTFAGLGTDAWLSNYAVGIGSTQFPTGTRFAAGNVQVTQSDLSVVRNINASGIITGTLDNTLTLATTGNGITGSATYDNSGATTFTVTSDATDTNTPETIVHRDGSGNFSAGTITANLTGTATTATKLETARDFSVSGDVATASPISFDGISNVNLAVTLSNNFNADTSGIITASRFVSDITTGTAPFTVSSTTVVTNLNSDLLDGQEGSYYTNASNINAGTIGDAYLPATISSDITGNAATATTAGTATTATNLSDAANITTGTISSSRLTGSYNIDISGNAATATTAGTATTATNLSDAANITTGTISSSRLTGSYNIDISGNAATVTYAEIAGVSTSVIGGIASVTQLNVSGISTFNNDVGIGSQIVFYASSGIVTATAFYVSGGNLEDIVGQKIEGISSKFKSYNSSLTVLGTELGIVNLEIYDNSTVGLITAVGFGSTAQYYFNDVTAIGLTTDASVNTTGIITSSGLNVNGYSELDYLNVSGVSTFNSSIDLNSSIDISGHAELDQLNVSGVSTFAIAHIGPSVTISSGIVTAIDFNTTSDQNLKTNIQTIENPLDKIVQIRGVNFEWKENNKPSAGVIAQEVEKVLPQLVNGEYTKTVNYNGLIGLLIEVVKKQQIQIDSFNERLSRLE